MAAILNQIVNELKRIGAYDEKEGGVIAGIKGNIVLIQDEAVSITGNAQEVLAVLKTVGDNTGYNEIWDALADITTDADDTEDFEFQEQGE